MKKGQRQSTMPHRDKYYNKAKQEGYRARSAYKLKQIDDEFGFFSGDESVLDLGAAPGGWLQVAQERAGTVVGVDLQEIEPIQGVEVIQGDIREEEVVDEALGLVDGFDVVLCDASPNISGEWSLDHARSVDLAGNALRVASAVLVGGGCFVVKVFQGDMMDGFLGDVRDWFGDVSVYVPEASRDESSEVYVVARGFVDAPVSIGEELSVEVVDMGEEGDGVAYVEEYVLFIPDVEIGDAVGVEIVDVKERFGFAERIDEGR